MNLIDDVWIRIFLLVVDMTVTSGNTACSLVGARAFPFVATHVCAHWRALALSAPLLWSFIHIGLPFNPKLTEIWHKRSVPSLIDFSLSAFSRSFEASMLGLHPNQLNNDVVESAISSFFSSSYDPLIFPNLGRYRSFVVRTSTDACSPSLQRFADELLHHLHHFPRPLPSLQRFIFRTYDFDFRSWISPVDVPQLTTLFPHGAPALVHACITYPFQFQPPIYANLRFLHINVLRLPTVRQLHAVLAHCRALENLLVDGDFVNARHLHSELDYLPKLDHLEQLNSLEIRGSSGYALLRFASLFSHTPCRRLCFPLTLWLDDTVLDRSTPLAGVNDVPRCFPALQVLLVNLGTYHPQAEKAVLRLLHTCFPDIHTARFSCITEDGISLLEGKPRLWPKIHTLGLSPFTVDLSGLLKGGIRNVVMSRETEGVPLRKLEVDGLGGLRNGGAGGQVGTEGVELEGLKSLMDLVELSEFEHCESYDVETGRSSLLNFNL